MIIILSQKIDSNSAYSDELFKKYHYPARYKNQIHIGDVFVYYQGNRYVKQDRYYFGTGIIENIFTDDGVNYYATLKNSKSFVNKVSIYLPDGKYVEQIGYESVRKKANPPWQSSIRPLSQQAYEYIIENSGIDDKGTNDVSIDKLKEQMKKCIRDFYLNDDNKAVFGIKDISSAIVDILGKSGRL